MEKVHPVSEVVYPDRGGYTGFSICIWNAEGRNIKDTHFISPWGSTHMDVVAGKGSHLIEGRFFVFGSLPARVLEYHNLEKASELSHLLFNKWKPLIDEISTKTDKLHETQNSVHVDEVLTSEILMRLK